MMMMTMMVNKSNTRHKQGEGGREERKRVSRWRRGEDGREERRGNGKEGRVGREEKKGQGSTRTNLWCSIPNFS